MLFLQRTGGRVPLSGPLTGSDLCAHKQTLFLALRSV